MENLSLNEQQSPIIDREKLLVLSQDRELNRLFSSMESDRVSIFDAEEVLLNIGENNPKSRPYILSYVQNNSQNITTLLRENAGTVENKENPEITKKLDIYKKITSNLKQNLNDIQKNLNETTSLSLKAMDEVVGLFTDDNVFNSYKSSFDSIKGQALDLIKKIQAEILQNTLSQQQKQVYDGLINELQKIGALELNSTGIIQMGINEVKQVPDNFNYAISGVKGEAIGLYEGTKAIISGSIDLLSFMAKYPFNQKYRKEFDAQAGIIYDFIKKEGLSGVGNKVYEILGKEMDRISKLPPEKQAQAIGKIAGNVISMLAVIKAGTTVASKLGKVGQAENLISKATLAGNIARAEKIREIASTLLISKRGLQAFEIILTGVAESVLLKGLSVSYKATLGFLESKKIPIASKVELLEQEILKVQQMNGETPEEKQILQRYNDELEAKKMELNKSIDVERQVKGLEKLGLPESFTRDLLESGLLRKEFFGGDLLRRFEDLHKKGINYDKMIDEVIKQNSNLTKEEALLIFSYTDEVIYRRLNAFLRGKKEVLDSLTPHNVEVSKRLALKLEQALEKMPNLKPGEDGFILRGDKERYWAGKIGDEIELSAFSSVSNNKKDIFLGEKHDANTQVSILGKEGRIKDISELSIAVNFGVSKEELETLTDFSGKLKKLPKTNNEGVILPNSRVRIINRSKLDNINYIDVKQTK
ncbi:MAG: hypothetical protein Q8K30_04240 [Candidatus Gracilibacteria bacterium]|nr:hypothetical protein [Candidatus Gracilibacteria bacterium]